MKAKHPPRSDKFKKLSPELSHFIESMGRYEAAGEFNSVAKTPINVPNNDFCRSFAKQAKESFPLPPGNTMDCAWLAACSGTEVPVAAAGAFADWKN